MKPAPFRYHRPASLEETLQLLATHTEEAKLLAGGQSLVPLMNFRLVRPAHLIDINRLPGLGHVSAGPDGLRIGPLARWTDVQRAPEVVARWPLLPQAIGHVGHPQIRNRGTLCGSAAHADPAAELPALLVALQAHLLLASIGGRRSVAAEDFFLGIFTTALAADEMILEIFVPAIEPGRPQGFAEFARRSGDFALAGAVRSGERLVAFGAGDRPVSLPSPAADSGERLLAALAALEITGDIHGSAGWRRQVIAEMARRAWGQAA